MAKYEAQEKYDKENVIQKKLKFNRKTDEDIINHLENIDNFQGYVKQLIRKDIKTTNI